MHIERPFNQENNMKRGCIDATHEKRVTFDRYLLPPESCAGTGTAGGAGRSRHGAWRGSGGMRGPGRRRAPVRAERLKGKQIPL